MKIFGRLSLYSVRDVVTLLAAMTVLNQNSDYETGFVPVSSRKNVKCNKSNTVNKHINFFMAVFNRNIQTNLSRCFLLYSCQTVKLFAFKTIQIDFLYV